MTCFTLFISMTFESLSCLSCCLLLSYCFCRSFDKAFQYAKDGNHFTTASSV